MISLIALTGPAHSGKSTLGKALAKALGYTTYAFAYPIKTAVNALFHWDQRHAEGELKEVVDPYWGFSPRHAYQTLGTEWGRRFLRDDIWLKYAERMCESNKGVVIADLRFENEAAWVRNRNGLIVHVNRDGQFGIATEHVSENGIIPSIFDYSTSYCRSVDELMREVPPILSIIQNGSQSV